jgi:hypothetical protein
MLDEDCCRTEVQRSWRRRSLSGQAFRRLVGAIHALSCKHAAARAMLPLALSQVSAYAEQTAQALNALIARCQGETLPFDIVESDCEAIFFDRRANLQIRAA